MPYHTKCMGGVASREAKSFLYGPPSKWPTVLLVETNGTPR